MCLAIPGRIEEIDFPIAEVNFNGLKKKVRVDLIDNPKVGDYVLVHVGMAIQKIDEGEAKEIIKLFEKILEDEH